MINSKAIVKVALAGILLITAAHNQSATKDCREVRRLCDRRCDTGETYVFNTTIQQPRFCTQNGIARVACRGELCEQEEDPHVCERQYKRKVACEPGCAEKMVLTRECGDGVECSDLANGGCHARGEDVVFDTPETSCRKCGKEADEDHMPENGTNSFATTVSERGYLVLPFEDDKLSVRNVRCFAGFFEDEQCDGVSEVCRMGGRSFNSVLCSLKVCWQCRSIKKFEVSKAMERYCRYLDREVCTRVTGGFGVSRIAGIGKMKGLVRTDEKDDREGSSGACVDGCRRRVLGCGRRTTVCAGDEDACEQTVVERFPCPKEKQRGSRQTIASRKIQCGTETVPAVGRATIGNCRRLYCMKRVCE